MALRISGSTSAPSSIVLAADFAPRAQQLLAAGDFDDYLALFGQAAGIEDVHRRYWASVQLLERGLAASAFAAPARLPALFAAIAAGALEVLERDPREPKLLNYAGVALYELWSLDAATALFEAAKRLDPQLGQVDRNLQQLAARRRALRGAKRGPALHPAVAALARRALALAPHAQPASDLRLSLCMIVRDEQEMLPRCLAAVADAVDEIVIVDTGSSDDTIAIARSFGAHVIEREWTGSFADARNVSFDAASGDWLMYLDADEVLVREDAQLLRSLTGRTWREAFYLAETNYTGELEDGTAVTHNALRVFRNRKEYRFDGRLHEQIAKTLPGYLPERLESTSVRVEHYGYLGAVRDAREKSRRNIELLRMQMAETPATAFLHYNLGSEYAAAADAPASLVEFERAWALLEADADRDLYEFAPALANRLVKALRVCGRQVDAIARAEQALARFPGFTDLVFEQGAAALTLGQVERACELWQRCIELGDAPRRYTATVGCGTYLPRISLAEVKLAHGDAEQAAALLERCVREHPEFYGSILPFASALLATGKTADDVVIALEQLLPELSATARFMLGTALYEAGDAVAGEAQFRIVLERQPHSSRARVALGETLLAQKRYAEAAAVAAQLPCEDPLAVIACRTELFARIVCGDGDGAAQTLHRAHAAGMTTAELDLFSAWRELTVDGSSEVALSLDALPLLAVALEALLRVQDFKAFELLVGLLERVPVDPRSRRQLLAEMYLRRGFLASAAEEWMAVCHERPDVGALLGLGHIAATRGMAAEASEFAAAALEHEPGNKAAADLLTRAHAAAA